MTRAEPTTDLTVANEPRARVAADTPTSFRRRFFRYGSPVVVQAIAVVVAISLHTTPFVPGVAKMVHDFFSPKVALDRSEIEVSMELDLGDENLDEDKPKATPPPPPESLPPPVDPVTDPNDSKERILIPTASASVAKPPAPKPTVAPVASGPVPDGTPPYVPEIDDVGMKDNPSGNPNNVVIILVGKTLRAHPVGERMGKLLPNIRQWQDFFKDTGIDAVKDVDLMVLQGPQLMVSTHVDTVLVFNKPMDEVEKSVHAIIDNNKGKWLDDMPAPTALAKADRWDRVFLIDKAKHALYITEQPVAPKGETWDDDKLKAAVKKKVEKFLAFPPPKNPPYAIKMMVTDPGKFSRVAVVGQMIPTTMQRLVFQVDAEPEGKAMIHIQLWDDTAENAKKDVEDAQSRWGEIQLGALLKGLSIPDATYKAKGKLVTADFEVDKTFLDRVFDIGSDVVADEAKAK